MNYLLLQQDAEYGVGILNCNDRFLQVSPTNDALRFLRRRLVSDKYRGAHYSQHNRYVMSDVRKILCALNQHASDDGLLAIRTTDISKRPILNHDEIPYSNFCDDVRRSIKKGSQDAMRKNYFPDFHRMGLINRYDKRRNLVEPLAQRKCIKYVSVTPLGKKLIDSNELDAYYIYSKCIDQLLEGTITLMLYILRDVELEYVDQYEYAFFVSAVGADPEFSLTITEVIDKIKQYRALTVMQRRAVIETLQDDLLPSMSSTHKPDRRDFHNWVNEAQQVYSLLGQTVYFDSADKRLTLTRQRTSERGITQLLRSKSQMDNYFTKHSIEKRSGFELHHIVPLAWSESASHFKLLDNWKNMLYIDGYSHAKVTQNRNKNIILKANNGDLTLNDFSGKSVYLKIGKNTLYDLTKQCLLLDHNLKLRATLV